MKFLRHTLNNGIRLVHQPIESPVAHCGIIINSGSRDEGEKQHGMAHLIEHLIFKGTHKRKAHHILSCMEDVGGEINAFTTKEETCIYTTFFNNYYQRAFELIGDIIFHSTFPVKEIKKEKEVIFDEINSYKDSPVEQIYDDFEEQIFYPNSIGRNILGTENSLNGIERNQLLDFYNTTYCTNEMVVSSAGMVPFKRVVNYFEKHFSEIPSRNRIKQRTVFNRNQYTSTKKEEIKKTHQSHCILGNLAYSNREEKRFILHLLNNILGGPGMNSRLNMTLREKKGLAYNIESNYNTYSDIGLLHIYFGTDKADLNNCIKTIVREIKKLNTTRLGTLQLSRAKRQLIGQIAIASENFENQMLSNGRSILLFDNIDSLDTITQKINNITAEQLLEVSNDILNIDNLSSLIYS
jgi:predicted Zn-dependent peptidase